MLNLPERRSLREDVRAALTRAISHGRFQPGERIIESQVAREFAVSQATVREALRELESTGLVVYQINRGCVVRKLSRDDVIEMYEMRALLEGEAAERAASRLSEQQLDDLACLIDEMTDLARADDIVEMSSRDVRFHQTIVEAAGNALLERLWLSINPALWTHLAIIGILGLPPEKIAERHAAVVEALRKRDPARARTVMTEHLLGLRDIAAHKLEDDLHRDQRAPLHALGKERG
jgi:DNA-binding GntR family transcriptional regulator